MSRKLVLWFSLGLMLCVGWSIFTHPAPWGSEPIKFKAVLSLGVSTPWKVTRFLIDLGLLKETALRSLYMINKQEIVKEERTTIAGLPVVIYYPNEKRDNMPALVNFHGGGWLVGTADTFGPVLARYAEDLGAVIVTVEYPMHPETGTKEIYESCYRMTTYFIQHADQWGVDPNKVVTIGESAGGNMAASLNLRMRDNNFKPMPRLQVLIQGVLQLLDVKLPSNVQMADGPVTFEDVVIYFYTGHITGQYCGTSYKNYEIIQQNRHVPIIERKKLAKDHLNHDFIPLEQQYPPYKPPQYQEADMEFWNNYKDILMDPYVNPLIAESHANLSEAIIFSSQYDGIRDDSYLYARRLRNAGVPVYHYNDPVGVHMMNHIFEYFDDCEHNMKNLMTLIKTRLE